MIKMIFHFVGCFKLCEKKFLFFQNFQMFFSLYHTCILYWLACITVSSVFGIFSLQEVGRSGKNFCFAELDYVAYMIFIVNFAFTATCQLLNLISDEHLMNFFFRSNCGSRALR